MLGTLTALHDFFGEIGTFYNSNEVPDKYTYPYGTFSATITEYANNSLMNMIIWDKNKSLVRLTEFADKIEKAVPTEGVRIEAGEDGVFILYRGNPFVQYYPQEEKDYHAYYYNLEMRSFNK